MGRRDVSVKSGDLTFWEVSEESVTVPVKFKPGIILTTLAAVPEIYSGAGEKSKQEE